MRERRGDRTALPQAPLPLAAHGGPAGVAARRAVRHRAPRPAQRAAQAGPGPRAARALLTAALHPAGLGAAALGGPRHRGAARRPGRDVHQDPPRAGRRRERDAAARERAVHRPRPARHAGAVGRDAGAVEGRQGARRRPSTRRPRCRSRRCGRRWGSAPRRPACPGALVRTLRKSLRNETSPLSLHAPRTMLNQTHHRLAPVRRPGLADRAAPRASARPPAPPSTTS